MLTILKISTKMIKLKTEINVCQQVKANVFGNNCTKLLTLLMCWFKYSTLVIQWVLVHLLLN